MNYFCLLQKDRENKKLEELVASQKQELEQLSSRCVTGMKQETGGEREGVVTKRCLCHSPRLQVYSEHSEGEMIKVLQQRVRF